MEWIRRVCGFEAAPSYGGRRDFCYGRRIGGTPQRGSLLRGVLLVLLFFVFGVVRSERSRARGLFLLVFRRDFVGPASQIDLRKLQAVGSGVDRVLQL